MACAVTRDEGVVKAAVCEGGSQATQHRRVSALLLSRCTGSRE